MGHFFSKVSLFIDKKEAAAHLILDQDFATAPVFYIGYLFVCLLVVSKESLDVFVYSFFSFGFY